MRHNRKQTVKIILKLIKTASALIAQYDTSKAKYSSEATFTGYHTESSKMIKRINFQLRYKLNKAFAAEYFGLFGLRQELLRLRLECKYIIMICS